MENNTLFPFERNRYYVGKLLTSSDFLAEQTYFNNKRRFINQMMFGEGVVCGLSVCNLDDLSVIVESGVAVDGAGREIVVESSVIRKLSSIEGFGALSSNRARLMLRYREELVHPVYSIAAQEQSDEEYELNRVREGWELFLTDAEEEEQGAALSSEFLNAAQLYSDENYDIEVAIPANVSCGAQVKLVFTVRKKTDAAQELSLDCAMQAPAFTTEDGEHELRVRLDEVSLQMEESLERVFWLTAQGQAAPGSLIIAKSNFIKLSIAGEQKRPEENFLLTVNVVDLPVHKLVEQELGRISLEARAEGIREAVCLAELSLQRSKNEYIVEKIEETGAKRYIHTAAAEELRREYGAYFEGPAESRQESFLPGSLPEAAGGPADREPVYATGVCEIPLGNEARQNEIVFSDEIMHGLGKGNVYVEVGFEYLDTESRTGEQARHVIFGDPSLFAKEEPPIAFAQTAVKVYDERGSFVVAAKLLRPTNYVVLVLRWVAFRLPMGDDRSPLHEKLAGKSISAVPPTVVMGTKESHYFAVRFKNMEPCTVTYELTEKDSGEISSDGIYTAPSKEGVYEIRISCADAPMISTYAYAVVKKKSAEGQA